MRMSGHFDCHGDSTWSWQVHCSRCGVEKESIRKMFLCIYLFCIFESMYIIVFNVTSVVIVHCHSHLNSEPLWTIRKRFLYFDVKITYVIYWGYMYAH